MDKKELQTMIPNGEDMIQGIELTGGIIALIMGFIVLWRKIGIVKLSKTIWRSTLGKTHWMLLTTLQEIKANQIAFQQELHPNGGSSIRDALNRIEFRQEDSYALLGARIAMDHQAMFITDEQGRFTSNNIRHQQLTGFTLNQIEGHGWINVVHPDDRDMVHDKWAETVCEQREFDEIITYITPHTHMPYKVHVQATRQFSSKKELRGWLGVVTPVDSKGNRMCSYRDIETNRCALEEER